jgi:UDP:flavonoid glycosyltransferase YjiC (YdhE family)
VVLPLWVDLYNYAALAEGLGVGLWASRRTAPGWTVEELSSALLTILSEDDPAGASMRAKARALGERARVRPGRDHAADIVAELAATGR